MLKFAGIIKIIRKSVPSTIVVIDWRSLGQKPEIISERDARIIVNEFVMNDKSLSCTSSHRDAIGAQIDLPHDISMKAFTKICEQFMFLGYNISIKNNSVQITQR